MQAKMLRNIGTDSKFPPYKVGELIEGNDGLIDELCKLGLAEIIAAVPSEPMQAIPPKAKKKKETE
jgi:hypothetical protein